MSELYRPNNELTRIAVVGESISNLTGYTYLAAITAIQSDYDALRRLTRTESAVRWSMMHPNENEFNIAGRVFPHHPNMEDHYSTWIKNVTDLFTNLQNQIVTHNDPHIQLTYIERKGQSVDVDLKDRLEFPVKFIPRSKSRHRNDLDPFIMYLALFANNAATIFRKEGDLVYNSPAGTEFENLVIHIYGIKDSLDAGLNTQLTNESLIRDLYGKLLKAVRSRRL